MAKATWLEWAKIRTLHDKLFLCVSWGEKADRISLARFQVALARNGVTKDAKDFRACDDFY